jgi:hypothetical protein
MDYYDEVIFKLNNDVKIFSESIITGWKFNIERLKLDPWGPSEENSKPERFLSTR